MDKRLKDLATKDVLKNFATKDDLGKLQASIEEKIDEAEIRTIQVINNMV